jgi:hypothetical protein
MKPQKPLFRRSWKHRFLWIILTLIGVGFLIYGTLYFGLNYFGEKVLKEFLKNKIHLASKGLYQVDFDRLNINLFNGNIRIYGFRMIPDTLLYKQMKAEGTITQALYDLSYESVTLFKLHILQLLTRNQINIRELRINAPEIMMVGFPDSVTYHRSRFTTLYKDIYPLASKIFQDFYIDSIKVEHGYMLSSRKAKSGKLNEGEYEFSAVLRQFSINKFSFYNKDRVFYARDVDLIIHNYTFSLADSLYLLTAESVGFSLTRSELFGKNLVLRPNFGSRALKQANKGIYIQLDVPEFLLQGIDLYQVLVEKQVAIENVDLTGFRLKMFKGKHQQQIHKAKQEEKKIKWVNLFTILQGKIQFVSIDTLRIRRASFEYYPSLDASNPEIRVASTDLDLYDFHLDSLSHLDRDKVLYADDFELEMNNISILLRDGIHGLNTDKIRISTTSSLIDINGTLLYPDPVQDQIRDKNRINTVYGLFPELTFTGIDIKELYHKRDFNFKRLEINEPEIKIIRNRPNKNINARFSKAEDLFSEKNDDVLYQLFHRYLRSIYGEEIEISHGFLQMNVARQGEKIKVASGLFSLILYSFLIDSVSGMNTQGYFYSRDFDFVLDGLHFQKPDGRVNLAAEHLHIKTIDSLIEIRNISFIKDDECISDSLIAKSSASLSFMINLDSIRVMGLNHRRLFLDRKLVANSIRIFRPVIHINSEFYQLRKSDTLQEVLPGLSSVLKEINLHRLDVREGHLDFLSLKKNREHSFSLDQLDFIIKEPRLVVPVPPSVPGAITFDSLLLWLAPFHGSAGDDGYFIQIGDLSMDSYPVNIYMMDLRITPSKRIQDHSLTISVSSPEVQVKGFLFDRALFEKKWWIDTIVFNRPDIRIKAGNDKGDSQKNNTDSKEFTLPPFIKHIYIGAITSKDANIDLDIPFKEKPARIHLSHVNATINGLTLDSINRISIHETPIKFTSDISAHAHGMAWISKDSLYDFSFSGFGFSTSKNWIYIDSFFIIPRYSREELAMRNTYQKDRLEIKIPHIDLYRIRFDSLIRKKHVNTERIDIRDFTIENYRDKRLPFSKSNRPPMLPRRLRQLPYRINVDTMNLNNGLATYLEQRGPEPGVVFFDEIRLSITGITNDPKRWDHDETLIAEGTARLMGKGHIHARIQFPLMQQGDTFTCTGNVDDIELKTLNPMVTKILPVTITGGKVEEIHIKEINASGHHASGRMNVHFSGLKFRLNPNEKGMIPALESAFISWLCTMVIPSRNPNDEGKLRNGIIYYERDPSKGFINYLWKSVWSGIKSTVGFSDQNQREINKSIKHERVP